MTRPSILQNYPLSQAQLQAALAGDVDVAVTAGAGTGKTRTLVARYLKLLADGLPLRQIVAITFTRKAAREMRNRVRKDIAAYLAQADLPVAERDCWQVHFKQLDAARIGTIHNLCSEILHAHPAEAKIDPRFDVLDETQTTLLVQEAVEATLAWAVGDDESQPLLGLLWERKLLELITMLLTKRLVAQEVVESFAANTILEHWQAQLEAQQREEVRAMLAAPEFVAAYRCLRLNKARDANDNCELERQTAVAALHIPPDMALPDMLRQLSVLPYLRTSVGSKNNWSGEALPEVRQALRVIKDAYKDKKLIKLDLNEQDTAVAEAMPAIYRLFEYAQAFYKHLKAERDALDFDDLEELALQLLEQHPTICRYWQGQVRALLVDEFQDTNARQARLLHLLCPDPGKLFVVGDAKQSIYRFRGADVSVFASKKADIESKYGALIDLDTSYRAHAQLLADMNALLAPVLGEDSPQRPSWVAPFAPLAPGDKVVHAGLARPFVEFHLAVGNKSDALPLAARALVARLAELHAETGLSYGDMAILCRSSGAFQYYEDELDAVGVPYLTVAGKGFYERPEIRDVLNALQAIADPHDDLALVGLLRSPVCGLSDVALYQLALQRQQEREDDRSLWQWLLAGMTVVDEGEVARLATAVALIIDLNRQAGRIPVADICKQFLDRTYYRATLRRAGQLRALRNIGKLLTDIHTSELVSITEFLEYAQALRDSGSREGEARGTGEGVVQIMSIHAAKGLEFPVVVLGDANSASKGAKDILLDPGLGILLGLKDVEGANATSYELGKVLANGQEEAEKDRLLYVALTRAEQLLLINGSIQKSARGVSSRGWLAQLAAITGLSDVDLSDYDETGMACHRFDLSVGARAMTAVVYEPMVRLDVVGVTAVYQAEDEQPERPPLQEPLPFIVPQVAEAETPQRVWQVVPTALRPQAPAWVIGSIVHEALALWRFPDDSFDIWASARAREYGLTDQAQIRDACIDSARLLRRFQQHPRFQEIATAERRMHEVPFHLQQNGHFKTGYIDLLYQKDGVWRLVDFKTDRIQDVNYLPQVLEEKGYRQQVQGYGTAVYQLKSLSVQLEVCWLDYLDTVHFTIIDPIERER